MDGRLFSRRFFLLSLVGLVLCSAPSWAADVAWTVTGAPTGGNVYKVIVDPTNSSNVYALSDPGVYQSSDGGASWTLIFSHPGTLFDLAMAPSDPLTLYTTTFNKQVYKTTDGGADWATVTDPVSTAGQTEIVRVTVDPTDAGVVYVLTDNSGIYKTTDGGSTWNAMNTGLASIISTVSGSVNDVVFRRLIVDPTNNQMLYLAVSSGVGGTNPDGLYKSNDGGGHWNVTSLTGVSINDVDMDPTDVTHLAAVSCYSNGYYSVTNSGAAVANTSLSGCPQRVRFDPSNIHHLYAGTIVVGLSESSDDGASWTGASDIEAPEVFDVAIDPTTPAKVFAGSAAWGLYFSSDTGTSWALANVGIDDVEPSGMATGSDGAIYIGSDGTGVLKSSDGGASWAKMNTGIPAGGSGINIDALVQDPVTPSTLYTGTQSGLFQTVDGGGTWSLLNNGITDPFTLAIGIDPQVNSTVYDGTLHGFFKSVDGGATWAPAGAGLPATPSIVSIAVDPTDSNIVFVGSDFSGLYLSTDGGADFAPASSGLASGTWITSIAFDPADHNTVYVSTLNPRGFFISTDGGASWSESDSGFPFSDLNFDGFAQTVVDPATPSTIFLMPYLPGATGTPVYFSTDAGVSWNVLTTASTTLQAQAQAVTRRAPGVMSTHASTESTTASSGVKMTWLSINPKKPSQLVGMGADHKLYVLGAVSTSGGGTGGSGGGSGGGGGGGSGGGGGGGGSGGGSGGGAAASGGGGNVSLITGLLLLGFALRRGLGTRATL